MNSINERLSGVFTALVTPFKEEGSLDLDAFDALIDAQLAAGVAGLVPVGTTGEAPTLNDAERTQIIQHTVERAAGKAFVLAGTGANDTTKAIAWTRQAEELGADGCLVVAPYYNKPTQQGLLAYFGAIAECTSLPIVLYSVPGRCGIEIAADTAATLHEKYANIVGIKEAGGTVDRVTELRKYCGKDFLIQSISVVSNLAPELMIDLLTAWREGRTDDARDIHDRVSNLASAIFIESSPVPVKTALAMDGRMQSTVRSPLVPLSSSGLDYLQSVLAL